MATMKHLGLGAFAAMHPPREKLDTQMAAWNAMVTAPTWHYPPGQKANFVRDRRKALVRLLRPDYQLPAQKETISYDNFSSQSHSSAGHREHGEDREEHQYTP
jgi:hypothetical protein